MRFLSVFLASLFYLSALGQEHPLKLAGVFADNMVLQREQNVPVWGRAQPGAEITVTFAEQTKTATANADGRWRVVLDPMPASSNPWKMTIQSSNTPSIQCSNVLVGDVWFASGQSNMHFQLKNARGGRQDAAAADFPLIRQFEPERITKPEAQEDCEGEWKICSPETAGDFSAVAFYFARKLHHELDVPIGLIQSTWGGSPIEAWSPMESLTKFPVAMDYKAQMDRAAETFDEAAAEKHNKRVWDAYNQGVEKAKANQTAWPAWPREKIHPQKSHRYPANIYNAMVHPLAPYSLRGAIWYQGENNGASIARALEYRGLLENMITQWRELWQNDFPFYAVQLVNFKAPQTAPVEDTPWPFVREGIFQAAQGIPKVGMAVGIDVGEAGNIHPKNKLDIGLRLAQQALAKTYGQNIVPGGPLFQTLEKQGDRIVIRFTDVGSGLIAKGGPLKRFAIAGADRMFVKADAVIDGDTVVVRSDELSDPVAVRYAWAQNPAGCNLYNKEGFPASPFRTDNWPPVAR